MTTASDTILLDRVLAALEEARVPCALIGAAALAVHGISRSTLDLDLLVTDTRVLDPAFWPAIQANGAVVEIRAGDAADPLAGVVRCRASGQRDVDVVVGRHAWQTELLQRAQPMPRRGRALPTARAEDLILLKLYAGGSQDRWDIEQLLDAPDRDRLVASVDARLPSLPPSAQRMWRALVEHGD